MTTLTLPGAGFGAPRRRSGLLMHWRGNDASLTALTGQAGTLTRASAAMARDSAGGYYNVGQAAPKWCAVDADGDGVPDRMGILLERYAKNLVFRSDDPVAGAGWNSDAAIPMTANAGTCGVIPMHKFLRNAVVLGDRFRSVTALADGTHTMSILARFAGETGVYTFGIYDTTAAAYVIRGDVTWAANGTASSIVAATGTLVRSEYLGGGIYEIHISGALVAAHANVCIIVAPAGVAGAIIGRPQLEAGVIGTSYVPSLAVAGERQADVFSLPFLPPPQGMTVLAEIIDLGTSRLSAGVLSLSSAGPGTPIFEIYGTGGAGFTCTHYNGVGGPVGSSVASAAALPVFTSVRANLYPDGSVDIARALAGGAELSGGASAASVPLAAAWSGQTLWLGDLGNDAAYAGALVLCTLKIAAGAGRSLAAMQAAY